MARKPARMYREIKGQAYTRKEYMGGVPAPRIIQFDMGDVTGDFPIQVSLKAKEPCQVRHTSVESARIAANRLLSKRAGTVNYHMKVRIYPHHVLRENKLATGAGLLGWTLYVKDGELTRTEGGYLLGLYFVFVVGRLLLFPGQ